jgi:hypothetical protein
MMFNADHTVKHARLVHENLSSWIGLLLSLLANKGIDRQEARMKMTALLKRMNSISHIYAPPTVTLTLTLTMGVERWRRSFVVTRAPACVNSDDVQLRRVEACVQLPY